MTGYINKLRERFIVEKDHKRFLQSKEDPHIHAEAYKKEQLTDLQRSVRRLRYMLETEIPVVYPDEKIALIRTVPITQEIFTRDERRDMEETYYFHDQGKVNNINPEYIRLINVGFAQKRRELEQLIVDTVDDEKQEYWCTLIEILDMIQVFAQRYGREAEKVGNKEVAESFANIPANPPRNFKEALQFLRLIHYCLWCSYNFHNTFGRFDQYMYPFYLEDIRIGRLTKETALELVEEFFISCNKDSDLYHGAQQGDNGQSMVLGGLNSDGSDSYNELSELCLQASLELKIIDPKINLRVNKNTSLELYKKGTELTKQGLGFPQYANDDIIIPALLRWGYDKEDAYNYVVAACWEFIIPGRGMDIVNIDTLSFLRTITDTVKHLPHCVTFEDYLKCVHENMITQAEKLIVQADNIYLEPAPLMSFLMDGCIENAKDVSMGNKYNNYGFHGAGLSTAVDSLAAIRKYVYEEKIITPDELVELCQNNFAGQEELQNMLRYDAPKFGNDDDRTDELASLLLDWFADAFEGRTNERGGIFRAGTGSAMHYIRDSENAIATPDGRRAGEEIACNYSPSLFMRADGPVSIIKSFVKPHLERVANGGPLTIELSDSVFRNDESVTKVAMFIKSFIDMGGHQMQINAVNREMLLDAKKHPEKYRNLIVRVWGWSGYFVELDECYQNHIIKRMELVM